MHELATDVDTQFLNRDDKVENDQASSQKFGTFLGVFVPCILMLFGVIIFLRLGWIVGIAGLATTLVIIGLASLIALITVLSMSAIATNIEVKAGGIYYIISRSLGFEVGSAVGLPLYIKESLTIAFCVIGFAESLKDLIPSWDITYIGIATLVVLTFLAYTSVRGAMKVQMVIFIITIAALLSLFTGTEVAPMQGESSIPAAIQSFGFWTIFAIFFPAMTGVESSVALSGDLLNPSKSLPVGTISAILIGFVIYAAIATFLVYHVPLDRLVVDPFVMQDLASVPSLIVLGIWGATLSSALGGLLGAPRTLKAIADDGIVPKIFSKTYGLMGEPRIATLATFLIALLGVCFGTINVIAPLLSMISLICYGVLNFSAGIETLISNPSWRPRLPIHWTISLSGAILCLIAMLMIAPGYAILSIFSVGLIYFITKRREFKSTWDDIQQGMLIYFSRLMIYGLAYGNSASAAKSWRPHFLIFTKFTPEHSTPLLKFSEAISQSKGFLTMASFVAPGMLTFQKQRETQKEMALKLQAHNIKSIVKIYEANTVLVGMRQMLKYYGLGPLMPNTILFGGIKKEDELSEFVGVLQSAISRHYNIVIINDDNHEILRETNVGKGDIHVWWDDSNPDNSNLMIILAYMLQCNPSWKSKCICMKAIVTDELQKKAKLEQFQRLNTEKRLFFDIEIYVSSLELKDRFELMKAFSADAEIILTSLNPPPKQQEFVDEYLDYLLNISKITDSLPGLVLVLSSEHTPLDVILQ